MKIKFFAIALAGLTIGLLGSCQKDNPQQNDLLAGALPGKFSVSETKQVYFSQGNLYCDGKTGKFDFETDQYGRDNSHDGCFNERHVCRFYWHNDAYKTFLPRYDDYNPRAENDIFFTNATTETAKADFTVNGVTGKYRTLSEGEWRYLFNFREMKNGSCRYTINITYGGKIGLVIYPDDYEGAPLTPGTKYTNADFPGDCVFLPAMGYRSEEDIKNFGSSGIYWASSAYGKDYAYIMSFSSVIPTAMRFNRWRGASVRLVADVE